jgi:hypothetical protein
MTSHVPQSKCYAGERVLGRAVVTVHVLTAAGVTSYPLAHAVRHSPDGFNWGYRGHSNITPTQRPIGPGPQPPHGLPRRRSGAPALPRLQGGVHRRAGA